MASSQSMPLVAVDVGNSRVKLGVFEPPFAGPLPHVARSASVGPDWSEADLAALLPVGPGGHAWAIASVNRPGSAKLNDWLARRGATTVRELAHGDMPLPVEVDHPDRVGLDRLANVVAANRLRPAGEPAIVIDMGTALTVSLVSPAGAFAGGAILPGVGTSARALHEFTDLLPLVEVSGSPPAVGKSTADAIRSGLYWGAVGAVRELVAQLSAGGPRPQIFLTGGAGPLFADVLAAHGERAPHFVPHLTLAGIAIAALALEAPGEPA
jgi:type III pantothenate kinase